MQNQNNDTLSRLSIYDYVVNLLICCCMLLKINGNIKML